MTTLEQIQVAYEAKKNMKLLSSNEKDQVLIQVAVAIDNKRDEIIASNQKDLLNAKSKLYPESFIDRLILTPERIDAIVLSLKQISMLKDPLHSVIDVKKKTNGLLIIKKREALGLIGAIYESRPNVTIDIFGLAFKSGNVIILRGGKEAYQTNLCLVNIVKEVLFYNQLDTNLITLISDTSRNSALEMMHSEQYIDLLIPRGGKSLIDQVAKESTVPVIATGAGNCHIYVDKNANIDMALSICFNAKVDRPGVCNSVETLLVHKKISETFLTNLAVLFENKVEIRGDEATKKIISRTTIIPSDEYYQEYDDLIIKIKVVEDIDQAIAHIDQYSSRHSESIITEEEQSAKKFMEEVDSSTVYHNASTRFTDGFEFGYGAEVGISTQKLHARGPMGLEALTTTKYYVYGNGQIRETSK